MSELLFKFVSPKIKQDRVMKDFTYYAPTEVIFGANSEEKVAKLIKRYGGNKVLIHYGGGSAERSGLLGKIRDLLNGEQIPFVELGGVVPNPRLSKVYEGIELDAASGSILSLPWEEEVSSTQPRRLPTDWPTRAMCGTSSRVKRKREPAIPWQPY